MNTHMVPRAMTEKANMLAQTAHLWSTGYSKRTGQSFYVVPGSTAGVAYWTDQAGHGCTCPSYRHRGVCAHAVAARLESDRRSRAMGLATDSEVNAMMATQSGHKSYWLDLDDSERIDRAVARTRAELAARGAA